MRDKMRHPRHGHSATWFGEKFIVVTGSRKEKGQSQVKCEMYNSDLDIWFDMPDLNVGRHYHSSCQFQERLVYVFCGIANQNRKYINSIERYDHTTKNRWSLIELQNSVFPDRQGCGVTQFGRNDIIIFGGFAGYFKSDAYIFQTSTNTIRRIDEMPMQCFFFQMPVAYDPSSEQVYAAEFLSTKTVLRFNTAQKWKTHMSIQQGR